MRAVLFAVALLIGAPSFAGGYGNNNGGQGEIVNAKNQQVAVDVYMDVNSADCYDTSANAVDFANAYAANRNVAVNLHVVNNNHNDVVRFQNRVAFRRDRNVNVRIVRNVRARNLVRGGNLVVFRVGRRQVFARRGAFNVGARRAAQRQVDFRVRF